MTSGGERRRAEAIDTATGLPLETADRNELNRLRREIAELQNPTFAPSP